MSAPACECGFCRRERELLDRIGALEAELVTEQQFRRHAEQERDRALEDLCALQEVTKGSRGPS